MLLHWGACVYKVTGVVYPETNSPPDITLMMSNHKSDRSETQFCVFTAERLFMKLLAIRAIALLSLITLKIANMCLFCNTKVSLCPTYNIFRCLHTYP